MTVEPNAITYLRECDHMSKMIVTTSNKPSWLGWAAVMSQHATRGGGIMIRVATSFCRMRAR